jgi:hypothetical protein
VARKVYTGKPGTCGGTFTVDADVEALTVYSASITLPSPVEGSGGSRSDTHTLTVDVFGGAQMAYLGSVDLVQKVHTLPADTVTGSDYASTWVATTPYPTARRIVLRGTHSNSTTGQTTDGVRLDATPVWGPASKPANTILAQGVVDLGSPGSPAELEYRIYPTGSTFTTLEGYSIPQLNADVRRKPGSGYPSTTNLAIDVLDDRGNWIEVTSSVSSASWMWVDWHPGGFSVAAHVNGTTPYNAKFPGTAMPLNPTKVSVRRNTDPVGNARYGAYDFSFLTVVGPVPAADLPLAFLKVGFDVSMDSYQPGTTSVTAPTGQVPAVTDGTNTVVAVPNGTGGVDVKKGDGTVVGTTGPLPGGPVNGPVTLRIDNGNLLVIYDGQVIWAWKISDLPWFNLNLSTVYVGIWNPTTHVVSTVTAVMPPLGGWRYRLFGQEKMPGIRPRLFGAWAHTWAGVTWVTDATSAYSTSGGWDAALASDPSVIVYPGGQEWLIDATEATKIARAGGLEHLEEVTP